MINLFKNSKEIIAKTLEDISSSANKMAINTKYRAKKISLESSRTELINKLGRESYELWQKGTMFPVEIVKILKEIQDIDEKIAILKAEHFAYIDPKIAKDLEQEDIETNQDEENK